MRGRAGYVSGRRSPDRPSLATGTCKTISKPTSAHRAAKRAVDHGHGVSQERHSLYAGRDLLKQLQPFAAEVEFIQHKTSGVAARPSEGFDEASAHRVGDQHEHDRHSAGRLQQPPVAALPTAKITSGARATVSATYLRTRSGSVAPQRISMRTLRPSVQPHCASVCANARTRLCCAGSSDERLVSTPMRRMRSRCCARAASGHAAAVPPTTVMNSRRVIRSPRQRARAASAAPPGQVSLRS